MHIILKFALLLSFAMVGSVVTLRYGAELLRAGRRSWKSALLATTIVALIEVAIGLLTLFIADQTARRLGASGSDGLKILAWAVFAAILIAITLESLVVRKTADLRWSRALALTLAANVIASAVVVPATAIMLPDGIFVTEIKNISMAPTLLGPRREVRCPRCDAVISLVPLTKLPPVLLEKEGREEHLDCYACGKHSMFAVQRIPTAISDDYIVINPERPSSRWNLVAVEVPESESILAIVRVVGLPGETIYLHGGTLYVNGSAVARPANMQAAQYVVDGDSKFGDKSRPWKLGTDEYCVLTDNSARGNDSRHWGPLSRAAFIGTVECICWPPTRVRVW